MAFIGRLDNLAGAALDIVASGARGWWKKSAVTNISAGIAYYGVKGLSQLTPADSRFRLKGWDAGDTAKAVWVGLSLYSIVCGIMEKEPDKAVIGDDEPKKKFVTVMTSVILLGLAANRLLKIKLDPLYATGITASLYAVGALIDKAKTA